MVALLNVRDKTIVQKYGGSSVATPDKLKRVAELVAQRRAQGFNLVVVVSAMGDATDELLARAREITPAPDRRELDMLLTVGERISMALLAMAIREYGHEAVSLTGSQCGIITTHSHTNARIIEVRPFRVLDELAAGRVVIVAGYQGVSYKRDITTLGRGGSDTTAIALAAALEAEACEIYSDVDGVYTADPRVVPDAVPLESLSYDEMQALAAAGAKVLNQQAVEFAKRSRIAIYARRTGSDAPGTVIRLDAPPRSSTIRGVAHRHEVLRVHSSSASTPKVQAFLHQVGALGVMPRDLQYDGANEGQFRCTFPVDDLLDELKASAATHFGPDAFQDGSGTITLVGEAMGPEVLPTALQKLAERDFGIEYVCADLLHLTFGLPSAQVADAARHLHESLEVAAPPR